MCVFAIYATYGQRWHVIEINNLKQRKIHARVVASGVYFGLVQDAIDEDSMLRPVRAVIRGQNETPTDQEPGATPCCAVSLVGEPNRASCLNHTIPAHSSARPAE